MTRDISRRRLLAGLAGTSTLLAGCNQLQDGQPAENSQPTGTPTQATATPEPQLSVRVPSDAHAIDITAADFASPLDERDSILSAHRLTIPVTATRTQGGETTLSLEELETVTGQVNNTEVGTLTAEGLQLAATELPTGESTLSMTVTAGDQQATAALPVSKTVPETYRVQRQRDGATVGSYTTPYAFDTHAFDHEQYTDNRQAYLEENQMEETDEPSAYEIMTGDAARSADGTTIGIERDDFADQPSEIGTTYPWNQTPEDRFEESSEEVQYQNSIWSIDRFNQLNTVEEQLDAIGTGVKVYQQTYDGGAPSGEAPHMAASIELIFEELTDQEIRSGGAPANPLVGEDRTGNHGVMLHYLPNHDQHWLFHDTTADILRPPADSNYANGSSDRDDRMYYAITDHDDKDEIEDVSYRLMKRAEIDTLERMAMNGTYGGDLFMNDEWFEAAANHILENGEGDPIFNPIEEAIQIKADREKYVGLYGESLGDSRIMVTDNEEIYNEVMEQAGTVSTDTLEGYCAGTAATGS